MENERFYRFLGLAARAGEVVFGAQACMDAIKKRKAKLILIDGSASENTKKDFTNACKYYRIEMIVLKEEGLLEKYLSKSGNKIAGIISPNFAKNAVKKYGVDSGGDNIE